MMILPQSYRQPLTRVEHGACTLLHNGALLAQVRYWPVSPESAANLTSAVRDGRLTRTACAVAAVGSDPAARADLAERLRAAADAYVHGEPAEWALAAWLQALAREVDGVG